MNEEFSDKYYIFVGKYNKEDDIPLTYGREYLVYFYESNDTLYAHTTGDNGYSYVHPAIFFKTKNEFRKLLIDEILVIL